MLCYESQLDVPIGVCEQRLKEWEVLKEAYMEAASIRETGAAIPQLDGEDDDEVSEVSGGRREKK